MKVVNNTGWERHLPYGGVLPPNDSADIDEEVMKKNIQHSAIKKDLEEGRLEVEDIEKLEEKEEKEEPKEEGKEVEKLTIDDLVVNGTSHYYTPDGEEYIGQGEDAAKEWLKGYNQVTE